MKVSSDPVGRVGPALDPSQSCRYLGDQVQGLLPGRFYLYIPLPPNIWFDFPETFAKGMYMNFFLLSFLHSGDISDLRM